MKYVYILLRCTVTRPSVLDVVLLCHFMCVVVSSSGGDRARRRPTWQWLATTSAVSRFHIASLSLGRGSPWLSSSNSSQSGATTGGYRTVLLCNGTGIWIKTYRTNNGQNMTDAEKN